MYGYLKRQKILEQKIKKKNILNKKKILITGGTGFIGYHLSKRCIKLNWSVTSLSTTKPKKKNKKT